jgi:DMSO/TMAO reductase YedYZ molybdopterin-dependent catalytic subunit
VSQLAAAVVRPTSAPVVAVGDAVVDMTPAPVKNWAIATLGPMDKPALLLGIVVILVVVAGVIGTLTARRSAYGLLCMAAFAVVGAVAALTRPAAGIADAFPSIIGAAAGAVALTTLVNRAAAVDSYDTLVDTHAPGHEAVREPAAVPADEPDGGAPAAPVPPRPDVMRPGPGFADDLRIDRRRLVVGMGVGIGVAGVGVVGGQLVNRGPDVGTARARLALPKAAVPAPALPAGTDFHIHGLSPFVTPNNDFYRVDTALLLPRVAPQQWKLHIHGMVDRPVTLSFDDLLHRPLREADITLTCVSNEVGGPYAGNARWLGAHLPDLLRKAGIRSGADMLLSTSSDGFTAGTPVDLVMDGREVLLAVAMNGSPLPVEHGFPVRQVVPGLYGYVSATKWIVDIKVTTFADDQAYWSTRGWSERGPIKTESRIDVPRDGASVDAGRVTIAGVAWAQHRGIERVEVRVDDGAWQPARLASVPGPDTWRQWALPWSAQPGTHRIQVRATDKTGSTQTSLTAPPEPNGASGWHTVSVTVK